MKILTLRIYNFTSDYDLMYNLHQKYDKNSIYLVASPNVEESSFDENTKILTVKGSESLIPGILEKTIKGIDYCLKNFDFDILVRSNISTIIDYDELKKQLSNIDNPYGGHIWGFNLRGSHFNFVSGSCIVLYKDICNYMISNEYSLIYQLPDDVAIGKLLYDKFPITFINQFVESDKKVLGACFYRFRKDESRYDERQNDIENIRNFYSII